jgi:phage terminase large subunit-like protein
MGSPDPCPNCGAKEDHYCKPLTDSVVAWFPRYLVHLQGPLAGQPFHLLPWQENEIIRPVFGRLTFVEEPVPAWVRQIRTVYVEIPKKNGKSMLGAGIALRLLLADKEAGPEIYSVAEDREQADIVFAMAKGMLEANSHLTAKCNKPLRRLIESPGNRGIYRVLPGDEAGSHGPNIHGLIFDELHTQKTRGLWDSLTEGGAARAQSLVMAFSTAGTDRHSICREQHDYGEQVKNGIIHDPTFHYVRYGVPESEEYDWEDEELWKACNPSLGYGITLRDLRSKYAKAKASPGRQNSFRNLRLNDWTEQAIRWMDLGAWDASAGMVDEVQLKGETCFGGLDASHTQHIASLCWDFAKERLWRFWLPRERLQYLNEETAGAASGWAQGFLTLTDGDVTDYTAIESKILEDMKTFNVKEVGYNSHSITPMVNNLTDKNVIMVPISQGITTLSDGTKEFERQVLNKLYVHGGNPVMRWMVDGLVVKRDSDQHLKPDKEKSKVNISGVTAGVMALDRRMRHVEEPVQDRELVIF